MADRRHRIVWTAQARSALNDILGYLAQDSPQAASGVLKRTLAAAEGLTSLAERGRIVPEIDDTSIREIFVHGYRLIYEVRIDQVTILHGARDVARWQGNN